MNSKEINQLWKELDAREERVRAEMRKLLNNLQGETTKAERSAMDVLSELEKRIEEEVAVLKIDDRMLDGLYTAHKIVRSLKSELTDQGS